MINNNNSRPASHSGTWYPSDPKDLTLLLKNFIGEKVKNNSRIIVAPHAGYSYSGKTAGQAFKYLDLTFIKKVIVIGPSHHFNLKGCALSTFDSYETPIGPIKIDQEIYKKLQNSGLFKNLNHEQDISEHSIEMEIPFIRFLISELNSNDEIKIVPILVGTMNDDDNISRYKYSEIISNLLKNSDTALVVSTDFCHWGSRFNYKYIPNNLNNLPIFEAIKKLDKSAMDIISNIDLNLFDEYIKLTKNTICGYNSLVLMIIALKSDFIDNNCFGYWKFEWSHYSQSSEIIKPTESSVSYAGGYGYFVKKKL